MFTEASGAVQSTLPYRQTDEAGQHAGHGESLSGVAMGHGGLGGSFAAKRQRPLKHWAIGVPQAPKAQVVPSGAAQGALGLGATSGHTATTTPVSPPPPSAPGAVSIGSSEQADAADAHATHATSATARSPALRLNIGGSLGL